MGKRGRKRKTDLSSVVCLFQNLKAHALTELYLQRDQMVDQMRENTLRFPLFRETSDCGRSEMFCSTGSVKNGLQLSMDAMGREGDFHDCLRAEELFSFDTQGG